MSRSPLHLTRRGRLVFVGLPVLLAVAVLLTVVGVFTTAPAAAEQGVRQVPSTPAVQVTVQPGQSLWQVAAENAHGRDTRDVVAKIVSLNGLSGDHIDAGRKLYIPLGS
ncbi:LysM peptidoglycan-binding domain-containing protein [Tersicoccus sp. MR15.9]|uniref:LysM peptidoglycan-binding domain-containing protein n=1 Tax=Tersicoccus mangrovi TaxID=3121635 RepID=UPI002FE53950